MGSRKEKGGHRTQGNRSLESVRGTAENRRRLWEELLRLSETVLDYVICVYMILMLAVFPFYYEEGYSHIGTDKSVFFCKAGAGAGKILAIPLALCLILRLVGFCRRTERFSQKLRGVHKKITPADAFALLYCAALLLSYACTDFRERALWGERGWYMGLLPQLMLICIYILVSGFWKPRKWLLYIALSASGAVFLMGCLNRFRIYAFGLEAVSEGYISTIGNHNWYCGYAVSVVFAGAALLWQGEGIKLWQRALLTVYTVIGYLSLVLQGSDSGLAALAVALLVMFCMSVGDGGRMYLFWQEMTLLWGGCLMLFLIRRFFPNAINFVGTLEELFISGPVSIVMTLVSLAVLILTAIDRKKGKYREKLFRISAATAVFLSIAAILGILLLAAVNTLHPGILGGWSEKALFTFNASWGSSRGATWSAGWKCFADQNTLHKLLGVGPDCMWSYISSGVNPEIYSYVEELFAGLRLTNAHNEWLTVLVDTGILGLAGFGGMMACGIVELLKAGKKNPAAVACGFCLLAHTVNGIFSFQQSMGVGTVFVMFGMGKAFLKKGGMQSS